MAEQSNATTLTIGDIIKGLTAAQGWVVLGAIATVLSGAFTLGRYFSSVEVPFHTGKAESTPVPCYKAKDWPKGVWLVWGHIASDWKPAPHDDKFPQIASRVMFDSPTSYVSHGDWDGAGPTKNEFRAMVSPPMAPGAIIQIHGQDGTGYTSQMTNGAVSPDGCMIKGDFDDSIGHRGSINLLFERSRYYVDP